MKLVYKLLHKRKDGTLGPLYINRPQRVPIGEWLEAEVHKTKGFAFRPGWHCTKSQSAPHIKPKNCRVWFLVEIEDWIAYSRPIHQGGLWYLANRIKLIEEVPDGH